MAHLGGCQWSPGLPEAQLLGRGGEPSGREGREQGRLTHAHSLPVTGHLSPCFHSGLRLLV